MKQEIKIFHDAGNTPLFFKTNIKYICLKANTFKSLTITNNADSFASSTEGWVQLQESLKSLFERMAAKYGPVYKLNEVTRYNVLIISDNTCGAIAFISDI